MSAIAQLVLLTFLQVLAGLGILSLFRIRLKLLPHLCLCILLGIAYFSLVPFLLQLFRAPLTQSNITWTLVVGIILLNLRWKYTLDTLVSQVRNFRFRFAFYELPFFIFISIILFLSCWRSYYLPPTPRDLTSGPEVIAEYAVKEKTMVNSVFNIDLSTTNNQFKPAYITSLQIIYKYFGYPFGGVWIGLMSVCFVIFLYQSLRERLHPVIAYFLICAFLAIPEMYAYTFIVLFDYSNAVFFFLAFYFLILYFQSRDLNNFALSAVMMGIATYIRSETLLLACFALPLIIYALWKKRQSGARIGGAILLFLGPSIILYYLSVPFYMHHYLPMQYDVNGQLNAHLGNMGTLVDKFLLMNGRFIFGGFAMQTYGTFIYLFILLLVLELIIFKRLNREGQNWIIAVLIIYLGLPFFGYLLPLFDMDHTTKRGLFKIFPLMLFCLGSNQLLMNLSRRMTRLEQK